MGIPSRAMAALIVAADSSTDRYVTAALTLAGALVLVVLVHRAMRGRGRKLAETLGGPEIAR